MLFDDAICPSTVFRLERHKKRAPPSKEGPLLTIFSTIWYTERSTISESGESKQACRHQVKRFLGNVTKSWVAWCQGKKEQVSAVITLHSAVCLAEWRAAERGNINRALGNFWRKSLPCLHDYGNLNIWASETQRRTAAGRMVLWSKKLFLEA